MNEKLAREEAQKFFDSHKEEEWFIEKYEPAAVARQREAVISRAKEAAASFSERLAAGTLNACFEYKPERDDKGSKGERGDRERKERVGSPKASPKPEPDEGKAEETEATEEVKEEGSAKKDEDTAKDDGEKEEVKEEVKEEAQEDSATKTVDKEGETADKPDAGKDADRSEVSKVGVDPDSTTLFLKAIPVSVKRAELEEVLKPSEGSFDLKLSDPMPYKDFIRLGWANYDSVDTCLAMYSKVNGQMVGEFKLEVVVHQAKGTSGKPKLTARSFAEQTRIKVDLHHAKRMVKHLDGEKGLETPKKLLDTDAAIEAIEKAKQSSSSPAEGEEDVGAEEAATKEEEVKDEEKEEETETPRLLRMDEEEARAKDASRDTSKSDKAGLREYSPEAQVLDQLILYLREVHLYEYYAGEEFMEKSELERRHPGGYCRNRLPDRLRDTYRETKQETQLDHKIRARTERKWLLDARLGSEFTERAMDRFYEENTTKVADNKYGCKLSNKLFVEPKFVRKHIQNKHQEFYKVQVDKVAAELYFHNYFTDPNRLRPPPPPGTFPGPGAYPGPAQGRYQTPMGPPSRHPTPSPMSHGKGGYDRGFDRGHDRAYDRGSPRMRGRSPPPRRRSPPRDDRRRESFGTPGSARALRAYQDLDGATDDLQPIDFDAMELEDADPLGL